MLRLKQQKAQKEAEAAKAAAEAKVHLLLRSESALEGGFLRGLSLSLSANHLQAEAEAAASGAADEAGAGPMSVLGGIGGQAVSTKKTKTKRTPGEIRIQKGSYKSDICYCLRSTHLSLCVHRHRRAGWWQGGCDGIPERV